MWGGLEKILETVSSYSTNAGKLWYLLVFVFRLIVVVTVGQSIYSDEQSAFRCSTKVIGCDNVCYDRFSKISHIRYWAFQLLAVTAPAVVFHFYSLNVQGRIEKIKIAENAGVDDESNTGFDGSVFGSLEWDDNDNSKNLQAKEKRKLLRRRKSVGAFKQKKVFANHHLVDVTVTREIRIAYYVNVVLRITIEAISLYFAYILFHFTDYTVEKSYNPLQFVLIKIPQVYRCDGEDVEWACGQHLSLGDTAGYVPCWVSRPWEKTIFMCYMNTLSAICCFVSVIELFQLSYKYLANFRRKRIDNSAYKRNLHEKINRDNDVSTSFHSVNEVHWKPDNRTKSPLSRSRAMDEMGPKAEVRVKIAEHKVSIANGTSANHILKFVSMKDVQKEYRKSAPKTQTDVRKFNTKNRRPVGIKMHNGDDEGSVGSGGYHSSEYESSSEEDESLASVSITSSR